MFDIWLLIFQNLPQVYKLPGERIYATYFGGDEKLGLPADNEAKNKWLEFLPPSRVLPFGCKVWSPFHVPHALSVAY